MPGPSIHGVIYHVKELIGLKHCYSDILLARLGGKRSGNIDSEVAMLAIVAAVIFALALLFDLADISSDAFNYATLVTLGLLFIALHLAGIGPGTYTWRRRRR